MPFVIESWRIFRICFPLTSCTQRYFTKLNTWHKSQDLLSVDYMYSAISLGLNSWSKQLLYSYFIFIEPFDILFNLLHAGRNDA